MAEPVLREDRLLETVGNDRELLAEIAKLFLEDSTEMVERLRTAVETDDADALWRAAHWVKGSVSNFAADGAAALALEVEQKCRLDGAGATGGEVEQLLGELERLCAALQAYC